MYKRFVIIIRSDVVLTNDNVTVYYRSVTVKPLHLLHTTPRIYILEPVYIYVYI